MDKKKTALITGGSRGIGRAICVRLAKDGMDIAFTYSSDTEGAAETKRLCEEAGAVVYDYKADVKDSQQCAQIVKDLADKTGGYIDALVNNAGITRDGLAIRMSDEQFNDVIQANLNGVFYMLREVSKVMMRKRSGKIVNISSYSGVYGNPGQINYSASKAGVIGMTKTLAKELAGRKINVNAIAPGTIKTKMLEALSEDVLKAMVDQVPLKYIGEPEDIANTVAFLVSDEARYITGQVLCVDGGMGL